MLHKCLINILEVAYFVNYLNVLGMSSFTGFTKNCSFSYDAKSKAFD